MAVLQDFSYSQAFFNYLDMCSNRTIKREERKACLFDVDDFVNFPGDFPSAAVKSEPAPQFCRLPTPYSQPYPFAAARPGNYYDQYLYRKFTSMFLLVKSRSTRAAWGNVSQNFWSEVHLKDKAPKFPELFYPCFCLLRFVCTFFVYVVFFLAKDNFLSPKARRNKFLVAEPENNVLPQRKYILVKFSSSTVVLRGCFVGATRHPGPKKEKKTSLILNVWILQAVLLNYLR